MAGWSPVLKFRQSDVGDSGFEFRRSATDVAAVATAATLDISIQVAIPRALLKLCAIISTMSMKTLLQFFLSFSLGHWLQSAFTVLAA
jgi:hypothetical protein